MKIWDWLTRDITSCKFCGKKFEKKKLGGFIHSYCRSDFNWLSKDNQTKLMKKYNKTGKCMVCGKRMKDERPKRFAKRCNGCGMINEK